MRFFDHSKKFICLWIAIHYHALCCFFLLWASSVVFAFLFLLTWNPVLFWFLFPFSKVWRSSSRFIQMKFNLARCRMMATMRAEKWHFPHFTRHNKAFLWPLQLQLCTFKNNDILSGEKILLSSFLQMIIRRRRGIVAPGPLAIGSPRDVARLKGMLLIRYCHPENQWCNQKTKQISEDFLQQWQRVDFGPDSSGHRCQYNPPWPANKVSHDEIK